jgi:hypothetical protein
MFAGVDPNLFYGLDINETNLFSDIDNLDSLTVSGQPGYLYFLQEEGGGHILASTIINLTSVTISATPIPAALPLFATALGGLGFMLRRRREVAARIA